MQCRRDCEHFNIPAPEFPELDELESDIVGQETMWSLYEEFTHTLDTMCNEDWISFRYKHNKI